MKTKERFAVCRIALVWLFAAVLVFLPGCGKEVTPPNGGDQIIEPPPEAALFDDLTLTTPYKGYNDGNPLFTQNYGADPFALVYEDRVYIYMTGDTPVSVNGVVPQNTYDNINTIRVVSSYDLVNWTEYPAIRAAGTTGIAKRASKSWAPTAAYRKKNGEDQFFLYFANGSSDIWVLTASSPTGPFTDPTGY